MAEFKSLHICDNIDTNKNLFRYMSLSQFLSMIENNKLFLKKVKLWEDTWECPMDQLPIFLDRECLCKGEALFSDSTVGQCWTYEKDSDAMWRIYSPDRQGVMIETTVESFREIEGLKHAVLIKVVYFNNKNGAKKINEFLNSNSYYGFGKIALKREAFKHENEVRLLTCLQGYEDIDNCYDIPVVAFKFNPATFIKSITFDPRADEWFVDTMKKYCVSKGLCEAKKSSLYEENFFEETGYYIEAKTK